MKISKIIVVGLIVSFLFSSSAFAWWTPTPSKTPTPQPSSTPTVVYTPTKTSTPCASNTATATSTATKTKTPTATKTNTPTSTKTKTPTSTKTNTPSPSQTPTYTKTSTPCPSNTPTYTKTSTPTSTKTSTPSPSKTATYTKTSTPCPSNTPTWTKTPTATATSTTVPSATPTATATPTGNAPSCNLSLTPDSKVCEGEVTVRIADGSLSSDYLGRELSYNWNHDCGEGTQVVYSIPNSPSSSTGIALNLYQPGDGMSIACKVYLTVVSPDNLSSSCETPVIVDKCSLDCLGKIDGSAKLDRCGVCNGDGMSCLDCSSTDVTYLLTQLDGRAFSQKGVVRSAVSLLRKASKKKNAGANSIASAEELYLESWGMIWSVPKINVKCESSTFCVNVSNAGILEDFRANSSALKALAIKALKQAAKSTSSSTIKLRAAVLIKKATRLHADNLKISKTVPEQTSVCM